MHLNTDAGKLITIQHASFMQVEKAMQILATTYAARKENMAPCTEHLEFEEK